MKKIVTPLLNWYDKNARVLPWRSQPTPYRVWVSEIMLQQTRVEAVLPYFDRFIAELPDIWALAQASEAQILKLWEGLGYYNRVRNMQKAAVLLQEQYGGTLPASYDELVKLPGIGSYTAGAIASIAFGLVHAAVDGNVLRVFARLKADSQDIALPSVKRNLEKEIEQMMPEGRTGDFTQALMELGATVCLPNGAPLCLHCPLAEMCSACAQGIQNELPVKKIKAQRRKAKRIVLVITDGKRLAISKRPAKGLLAGMWELPSTDEFLKEEQVISLLDLKGIETQEIIQLERAKHIFTHIEWHMQGYYIKTNIAQGGGYTWVSKEELQKEYAIPSAFSAFISIFLNGEQYG